MTQSLLAPLAVIITCFNKREFLADAVHSSLANNPQQIIVVDDGSLDGSLMEAQRLAALDPRITIISQRNLGAAAARNSGWRAATAPWLVFLDGDDKLQTDFATVTIAAAKHSGSRIVSGYAAMFGTRTDVWRPQKWDPYFIRSDNALPISTLVARDLVQSVAGYNESLPFAEDWDLWIRLGAQCPNVTQLERVVYEYRRIESETLSSFVDDKWELTAPLMMLANQALYNVEDLKFAVTRFLERGHEWSSALNKHSARHPTSPLLALLAGILAEAKGDFSAAINNYAAVLGFTPGDAVALWRIGGVLLRLNQTSEAYALLHQARIVRPDFHFLVTQNLKNLEAQMLSAN